MSATRANPRRRTEPWRKLALDNRRYLYLVTECYLNVLQISTMVVEDPSDNPPRFIFTKVLIDGQPIVDYGYYGVATDLFELWESTKRGGEFFIITCTCGEAACAGIQEGVRVSSDPEKVYWTMSVWGSTQIYAFERKAYVGAIEAGVQELHRIVAQHALEIVPMTNRYSQLPLK